MRDLSELHSRFPGYDVLSKWRGPSWNDKTREVIARRLAIESQPQFFTPEEFRTVIAVAERIIPQPKTRSAVPIASLLDRKLHEGKMDGYRLAGMPRDAEAWRLGLQALDVEAERAFGVRFSQLEESRQDTLLGRMQQGELKCEAWGKMTSEAFFRARVARDVILTYYAHPTAWNEIGWGGPASPRGYVRMDFDERDPWEAAEIKENNVNAARRQNSRVG